MDGYLELHCHSVYSLLDGAADLTALTQRAAELGMPALALTDHDALYGAVAFSQAAARAGITPLFGAELTLEDDSHLTLLVIDDHGWRNLCRLITLARRDQPKGVARTSWQDLARHSDGLLALSGCRHGPPARALLADDRVAAEQAARRLQQLFADRLVIELQHHLCAGDRQLLRALRDLADYLRLPTVATNNVHYVTRDGRRLHDLLTALRLGAPLDVCAAALRPNDEFYLKSGRELAPLFRDAPDALTNTFRLAERCSFRLTFGLQDLPVFPTPPGLSAAAFLRERCLAALTEHYGPDHQAAAAQLAYELQVIVDAGLANYLLIVWDLVRFARQHGIRCQGRGSAANSLVAYLLGIGPIDPLRHQLVFERFLSQERPELPDIDLDVDAARREELIQYLMQRYGREHAAMACTFITFQERLAAHEVRRALGSAATPQLVDELAAQLHGLPRHLGQHSGGMVLMGPPLAERVPIEPTAMPGRMVVQWDKDSLEDAGLVKIDVLGLRALSAVTESLQWMAHLQLPQPDFSRCTYDDPAVYAMLAAGDTLGVFQVESRAQATVLPRLVPRCLEDLIVAISLIRPGPIQGQMVHPYLRRRAGLEPVTYLHPCLEPVLATTLGVLLFQEQVLLVTEAVTAWPRGRGELLRRALSRGHPATVAALHDEFITAAVTRDIPAEIADQIFTQLAGFGGYSFPRSHAAAFAGLVYQHAWLKRYAPGPFYTGLLNHQPMGFWSPAVLIGDAKRHGLQLLGAEVNAGDDGCSLPSATTIRLGLRYVRQLGPHGVTALLAARRNGPFRDLHDLRRRTQLSLGQLEALILAGACDAFGVDRRRLLWQLGSLRHSHRELDLAVPMPDWQLPMTDTWQRQQQEAAATGVSVGPHLCTALRPQLRAAGVFSSRGLRRLNAGIIAAATGVLVVRQSPPTANGHTFLTLEDEYGLIDVILRPVLSERYRPLFWAGTLLLAEGVVQRNGAVVSLLCRRLLPLAAFLAARQSTL